MGLKVETTDTAGGSVVKVYGEVDLYSSPELRAAIAAAVSNAKTAVAVDLSEVPYMDSSGVATLVEGLRGCSPQKIPFVLINPSNSVQKVLQLARLDSVL